MYFRILTFSIASLLLIISGCKNESSTEPEIVEHPFQGIWFNSTTTEGIEIDNNGRVVPLVVNTTGILEQSTSNAIMKFALVDENSWTAIDYTMAGDTLKGTFEKSDSSLTFVITHRNNNLLTPPDERNFRKSYIGDLVVLKKFLTCNQIIATSISGSFSNGTFIISGSQSLVGAISIRVAANSTGTFDLIEPNKGAFSTGSSSFATSGGHTGTVTINILDLNKRYVAGEFSFDAISTQGSGSVVTISNGKFGTTF